ncbi:MAG: hypothetical protein ACYTJ0_15955, partial [Planctomycetota bacterium]
MKASTIAELFVEPDHVRVDLEIGAADLRAFRDLLPDGVYERLGYEPRPYAERLTSFVRSGLVIRADEGPPIDGMLRSISPRPRVTRDEITGEPLATGDEQILSAVLLYPLERPANALTVSVPRESSVAAAEIGFMAYHRGVAVNDFRSLPSEATLDLDWDDPWYTRFRHRNLWRAYVSPLSAFLYVDDIEVRKEVMVRPRDLQDWIDLGLADRDVIPVAEQAALKERIAAYLIERGTVRIDGREIEPALDRIHFVRRSLRTTSVIDPPEDLPLVSAMLGVIFVYPVNGLPDEVTMEWDLFSPRIVEVPAVATDEAGGLPSILRTDDPILDWKNVLTNPTRRGITDLAPPSASWRRSVSLITVLLVLLAVPLLVSAMRSSRPRPRLVIAGGLVAGAVIAWPFTRISVPLPWLGAAAIAHDDAGQVIGGLLRNVYRAFDYREESVIYDTLARSASGDLLTDIYLETRRALELRNQGGARARVEDVEVVDWTVTPPDDGVGFMARCTWNVAASVG